MLELDFTLGAEYWVNGDRQSTNLASYTASICSNLLLRRIEEKYAEKHPMASSHLSPDDLPPQQLKFGDRILRRQLDLSLAQRFQQQCNLSDQQLLATCDWSITTIANVVTLVIVCPDRITNWQVLNQVVVLGNVLSQFSQTAKLRIYSTPDMIDLFEIRVDELSIYQER
jgi:hypothetical protein